MLMLTKYASKSSCTHIYYTKEKNDLSNLGIIFEYKKQPPSTSLQFDHNIHTHKHLDWNIKF